MKHKGQYLFFDIECCNGYNICSFGYCIVSSDMKVIEKRDILINPEKKFVLSPKGRKSNIEFAYPEELFYKQDAFPAFYQEIANLLTKNKYIIIGHSVISDLYFLAFACMRYKLPEIDIDAFDSQKIFKKISNASHIESLEKILEHLEIDSSTLTLHKSCDDAFASFLVLKELCSRSEITLDELLSNQKECIVSSAKVYEHIRKSKKSSAVK